MSSRKQKPGVPSEVLEASVARFQQAIEECRERWVERWERAPRVRELVHAFEVVTAARVEDAVSDPDTFEAIWNPPRVAPLRQPYAPKGFRAEFLPECAFPGCDECHVKPRADVPFDPTVRVLLDIREGTLRVDYWIMDYSPLPMTDGEARELLRALVVDAYLARHPGVPVHRVLVRPLEGLTDPEEHARP